MTPLAQLEAIVTVETDLWATLEANPTGWSLVDLRGRWSEIHPHCSSFEVRNEHQGCMEGWIEQHARRASPDWAPWEMTMSDAWVTTIDNRVDEAAEIDEEVREARDAMWVSMSEHIELSDATRAELCAPYNEIVKRFEPKAAVDPEWWVPMHACHDFAAFQCALARAWEPKGDWAPFYGGKHSTVVDLEGRRVFDILLYSTMTADEIIEFALTPESEDD